MTDPDTESHDIIMGDVIDGVRVEDCEAVRRAWKNWVEPPPSIGSVSAKD